jgi:hypothetical protein
LATYDGSSKTVKLRVGPAWRAALTSGVASAEPDPLGVSFTLGGASAPFGGSWLCAALFTADLLSVGHAPLLAALDAILDDLLAPVGA